MTHIFIILNNYCINSLKQNMIFMKILMFNPWCNLLTKILYIIYAHRHNFSPNFFHIISSCIKSRLHHYVTKIIFHMRFWGDLIGHYLIDCITHNVIQWQRQRLSQSALNVIWLNNRNVKLSGLFLLEVLCLAPQAKVKLYCCNIWF